MSENTPILQVKNLTHIYSAGTPFEHKALDNVNLTVERGEFVALIGHTGSGKSTLIQHLNGLLRPTRGTVLFDGRDIFESKARLRTVRFHVGLLFQYPEYQLFGETVEEDVAFGPGNMGLDNYEINRRVETPCVWSACPPTSPPALRSICRADRSAVSQSPACSHWSRMFSFWMSRPPVWIRAHTTKFSSSSAACTASAAPPSFWSPTPWTMPPVWRTVCAS